LNGLYKELLASGKPFIFFDFFQLNEQLLQWYESQEGKFLVKMFTSGTIQNAPEISKRLKEVFGQILSAEELGASKDDPAAYRTVAKIIQHDPAEILLIDDDSKNIRAAIEAGLKTIVYDNFEGFKKIIDSVLES
jgi:FMN phosphatase YigB (HAD superfamily)